MTDTDTDTQKAFEALLASFTETLKPPPAGEAERIARIWKEVQDKTGIQTGKPSQEIPFPDSLRLGRNLALHPRLGLGYTRGFTIGLTDEQLAGGIAHELGHFGQKPPNSYAKETAADSFAAKHGYGDGLISVLERDAPRLNGLPEDGQHPPIDKRIAAIRAAIKKTAPESQLNLNLQEAVNKTT